MVEACGQGSFDKALTTSVSCFRGLPTASLNCGAWQPEGKCIDSPIPNSVNSVVFLPATPERPISDRPV